VSHTDGTPRLLARSIDVEGRDAERRVEVKMLDPCQPMRKRRHLARSAVESSYSPSRRVTYCPDRSTSRYTGEVRQAGVVRNKRNQA